SRRELWEIVRDLVESQGLTVLLSTAYLDEAERCGHVVVLHQGKVLAQGQPEDLTNIARDRVFVAELPEGQSARIVQSRLLDQPDVIDAVPDAGRVRFVRAESGGSRAAGGARGADASRGVDGQLGADGLRGTDGARGAAGPLGADGAPHVSQLSGA